MLQPEATSPCGDSRDDRQPSIFQDFKAKYNKQYTFLTTGSKLHIMAFGTSAVKFLELPRKIVLELESYEAYACSLEVF